jgi:hypothetical protein
MEGWNPPIPEWVFAKLGSSIAVASKEDQEAIQLAKESVNILMPRLLKLLRQKFMDKYYLNVSQRGTDVYYFFSTRHPVDGISLRIGLKNGKVILNMGWVPYDLKGRPEWTKVVSESIGVDDPELAGLSLLRLTKSLLARV